MRAPGNNISSYRRTSSPAVLTTRHIAPTGYIARSSGFLPSPDARGLHHLTLGPRRLFCGVRSVLSCSRAILARAPCAGRAPTSLLPARPRHARGGYHSRSRSEYRLTSTNPLIVFTPVNKRPTRPRPLPLHVRYNSQSVVCARARIDERFRYWDRSDFLLASLHPPAVEVVTTVKWHCLED